MVIGLNVNPACGRGYSFGILKGIESELSPPLNIQGVVIRPVVTLSDRG
jgi:hypothetical protein